MYKGEQRTLQCGLTLTVLILGGCGHQLAPPPPPPVEVTAVTVASRDVPIVKEYVGQTESSRQVEIRARVEGYLRKTANLEGSLVHAGDFLFQIDPGPLQLIADGTRAAEQDKQSVADNARENLARLKPLFAQNAVSKKDYDDAVALEKSASAALAASQAEDARARMNLGYARITSPLSGLASRSLLSEGSYINPAMNGLLTTVSQVDPILANFSISEDEKLSLDREVEAGTLRFPAHNAFVVQMVLSDGRTLQSNGTLDFAAPSVDPQTGGFALRASFPNQAMVVRPGQFVRLRVKGLVRVGAILVPQRAVMQGQAGRFVYVVNAGGQAEVRPVAMGDWQGDQWFVLSGLKPGERVIVGGIIKVQPGAPLKVSPEPEAGKEQLPE